MMAAPVVSVCLPCFRPGGMDILFSGLRDQTFKDFELILVDHRYEKRHAPVMDLAKRSGVTCIHVPEHRRNGKWAVLASAWNTAIMLARGRIVIFMPEYCWVPPDWIEKHMMLQGQIPAVWMAPFTMLTIPEVVNRMGEVVTPLPPEKIGMACPRVKEPPDDSFAEMSIFAAEFNPESISTLAPWPERFQDTWRKSAGRSHSLVWNHLYFHMRNESIPQDSLLEINGFDENLDRGKSHIDTEISRRLMALGFVFLPVSEPPCWMLDAHGLFPTMPQSGGPGRWVFKQCEFYALNTDHPTAPNPYSLREKAKKIEHWREAEFIPVEGLDVPDEEYY